MENIWNYIWAKAGRVPLRQKMLGIVVTSLLILGFAIALWVRSGLGGWLSYLLSEERVQQAMSAGTRGVFFVTVLAAMVGMVIAWLMTWVLAQPILRITRVAKSVESGDLSLRAPVWADDEIGELGSAFNAMIESLERSRGELEDSNEELRRRNMELGILYELAGAACLPRSMEEISNIGLDEVLKIPGVDAGKLVLLDQSTGELTLIAHRNIPPEVLQDPTFLDPHHRFFEQVAITGQKIIINNLEEMNSVPPVIIENGYHIFISVPIYIAENVAGALNILSKRQQPLRSADILFLETIGKELSATLEKNYLWDELTRKEASRKRLLAKVVSAQEDERQRISRELHDETGQALTTLLIQLKLCQGMTDAESMREQIIEMRRLASQTMEEVRRLALDLRPSTLDDLGLVPALEWFIKERASKSDLEIHFNPHQVAEIQLPHEKEIVLYRVIQETLTNTIRHAQAQQVWVELSSDGNVLKTRVTDDGCGFDMQDVLGSNAGGIGLLGIRERIELIGGTFKIQSNPGEGTQVYVETQIS